MTGRETQKDATDQRLPGAFFFPSEERVCSMYVRTCTHAHLHSRARTHAHTLSPDVQNAL